MLRYWSNVFAMLGVALIATAFFQEHWQAGCVSGGVLLLLGAGLHSLSLLSQRRNS